MNGKITYRQQYTRCGKQNCRKCQNGAGHGPYWYAYWSEKGRTMSKYIGIKLPEEIEASRSPVVEEPEHASVHPPTVYPTQSPALRVYALGQFRLERLSEGESRPIDSRSWRRRRARALLGCLLSAPGRRLGREQVMDILWPELDIDVAANRLNGAVHELRQILEPDIERPAASRLLRLEREILELADSSQIWVDAEAFEQLLQEARATSDPEQREQLLEEAETLYRGSYLLDELYAEWATQRRDALQRAWVGLLLDLANLRVERGDFDHALKTLDKLRNADPTNETALQRMMLLLTHIDRRGEALKAYRKYLHMLQSDDEENEPLPETRKLYDELRQGHHQAGTIFESAGKQGLMGDGGKSRNTPTTSEQDPTTSPAASSPPLQEVAFSRPALQLGRHNQSPLIGRASELEIMRQVLLAIEGSATKAFATPQPPGKHSQPIPPNRLVLSRVQHPHFLLLKGETGIGKTRLAEELSLEAYTRGWAVAWSRSYEQESAIPFRPWTELLRTLLHDIPTMTALLNVPPFAEAASQLKLERINALLPETPFPPLPTASIAPMDPTVSQPAAPIAPMLHEQERLHLWEATLGLLAALSNIHPLLLVLDDLHWADDSSIELLTYLIHHLQDQHILLVGTCRDGELTPQHALNTLIRDLRREQAIATVTVKPLTNAQISTLLSHLPGNIVQSIQTQAAGNPFFAEELARYVGATQSDEPPLLPIATSTPSLGKEVADAAPDLATPALRAPGSLHSTPPEPLEHDLAPEPQQALPEGIAAVLERRLNRLSTGCQALLGRAAVLGGSFELGQLLPMAGEYPAVAGTSDEDAVVDLLEEALRAGLLTEEGTGAHIIYHFWHPLIIKHLYERLSATRRAQLHRKAAQAIKTSYANTPQEKVAAAIVYHLSRGGEPTDLAYYAELAGNQAYALAAYSEALQYYLQVLQAFMGTPPATHSTIAVQIKQISPEALEQRSLAEMLHICQLLEYTADCALTLGNFEGTRHLYECLLALHTSAYFRQHMRETGQESEQMELQEAQIQALAWREIGKTWSSIGEYARADACYARGQSIMSQVGVSSGAAWACLHLQRGEILRLEGNFQESQRYLQEALEMLECTVEQQANPHPDRRDAPLSVSSPDRMDTPLDGSHAPEKKQTLAAQKKLPTRIERALRGDPLEIGYAHERLGIVGASLGQLSDGLAHMKIALDIYKKSELISVMVRVHGNMGAVYIVKGDMESARNSLREALKMTEQTRKLPLQAFVLDNLGDVTHRCGDLLEAENWFKQALLLSERMGDRENQNWCSVDLAALYQDLGNLAEAKSNLLNALLIGRAIKSNRCICYTLIRLADLRLAEARLAYQWPALDDQPPAPPSHYYQRLLLRTKLTLQRALSLEGMEIEALIEGKRLLATVYFLQHDLQAAQQLAVQTLHSAQTQEVTRSIGRCYALLASIMAVRHEYSEADRYFEQAIQIFRERKLKLDYARALYDYGLTLVKRGRLSTEQEILQPAERRNSHYQRGLSSLYEAQAIFAGCRASLDLQQVEQLLARVGVQNATL